LPVAEGLAALAFAAAAVATTDRLATVMGAVAAVVLAVFAVRDVVAPVRVSADGQGVTVVQGFATRRRIPWAEIVAIRVGSGRGRFGRTGILLEIDTGDTVHLFTRRDLGDDPDAVAETLDTLGRDSLNP